MNKRNQLLKYLISDYLTAVISWTLFYIFRKIFIESKKFGFTIPIEFGTEFYYALFIIPLFWLFLYYLNGYYKDVFRKSRLDELGRTFLTSLTGVLVIFFVLILDDVIVSYKNYYSSFFSLFLCHFSFTYISRLIITCCTYRKIQKKQIAFNTIIVGSSEKALHIFNEIKDQKKITGNNIIGFVNVSNKPSFLLQTVLPHLGTVEKINPIIQKEKISEVIIAIESGEHEKINKIINHLAATDVVIKIIPDLHDIITGKVKMNAIFGVPLMQVSNNLMHDWQEKIKQIIDFLGALFALLFSVPLLLAVGILVKLTSKGPVIYSHERIGRYGKPFKIYKFRTMCNDAEKDGPALSSLNDPRVTPLGRFLRKFKIDEIPNFINVLKGQMSIVGPRPEREYFINKILKEAPHYVLLHKVKPGMTSWGQVKFGYAKNIDEMVLRLRYDILYINNMSLFVDFKIIIYTVQSIFKPSM